MTTAHAQHESKSRLLDAALHVIRAKGYAAAIVGEARDFEGVGVDAERVGGVGEDLWPRLFTDNSRFVLEEAVVGPTDVVNGVVQGANNPIPKERFNVNVAIGK